MSGHPGDTPLGRAVTSSARVLGFLADRQLRRNGKTCMGAWMQPSNALVIVAIDERAQLIAETLLKRGLLDPQLDKKKVDRGN